MCKGVFCSLTNTTGFSSSSLGISALWRLTNPGVSIAAHPSLAPPLPFALCRNTPPGPSVRTDRSFSPAQTPQRVLDGAELAAAFLQQQLLHRHIFLTSGDLAHPQHKGAEAAGDTAQCLRPPNSPLVQLENKNCNTP